MTSGLHQRVLRRPVVAAMGLLAALGATGAIFLAPFGGEEATAAGAGEDTLAAGESLGPDQSITSADGASTVTMQSDGNLVVVSNGATAWTSNTSGHPGVSATMQADGNLVIMEGTTPIFATATNPVGDPSLVMQSDGNLVLVGSEGAAWSSESSSENAIQWYYDRLGSAEFEGYCERAVENSFGTSGQYVSAIANWMDRDQQQPYTAAPRGGLVFYDTSEFGHVGISLGNGTVIQSGVNSAIGVADQSYQRNPLGWAFSPW